MANTLKLKRSAVPGKVPTTSDLQLGEIAVNTYDGKAYMKKDDGTASIVQIGGAGGGDVSSSSSSSTDNSLARFDGTTGKLIQNSVVVVDDSGNISGVPTITDINYVDFNTGYATTLGAGQLGWDGNNTLGLGMIGGNVIQHIGEDQFFYCKASSAITKGQVVMFTGAVGASGVPTGAPATGIADGTYIMGVAAESIALNDFGLVQSFGTLRNVDTSAYADGDILWYNPSVTGGLTSTKPSAPNVKAQMAAVINGGSSGGGTILIRINPGSTLGGTDSNAQINGASNGQFITYDGTGGYWKNTSISAGTAISVSSSSTGVLTITNTAPDQTVTLTGAGTTSITGTYPNFTITSNDQYTGTVTSITAGTGLSGGTITTSGTIDLANTSVTAGSYTYASITVDAQGRLTAASSGASPSAFPSGTAMLFVQTSAPTGWTKSTTHDNKALRIVSGTASSGGSVAFTTAFASQTPSGSVSVTVNAGTLAVGIGTLGNSATTLATTQIPSHTHGLFYQSRNVSGTSTNITQVSSGTAYNSGATGGGGSHTHTLSGSPSISGSPSVTASSFTGTAINLAVQYVDAIIATKD